MELPRETMHEIPLILVMPIMPAIANSGHPKSLPKFQ
jgi:hypothetical protein